MNLGAKRVYPIEPSVKQLKEQNHLGQLEMQKFALGKKGKYGCLRQHPGDFTFQKRLLTKAVKKVL
jgi:hypothetical protein